MLFSLIFFVWLQIPAFALPLGSADISKMVQECPSLEEYRAAAAVIWDRKQLYSQDSQKRTVKSSSYVILCSPTAKFGWLEDQLVAPAGGSIELEQAAIFDPITSMMTYKISYSAEEMKHGRIVFTWPKMNDEYVFVLSYRQIYPEPDAMEDIAWISSEFPTWEGSVQVRIDKGQELVYESSMDAEPTVQVDSNFRRYGWFYFNQSANRGVMGLVESSDPYLVFSTKKGPSTALEMMNDLSSRNWPDIPEIYVQHDGSPIDADIKTIEKFWFSSSRLTGSGTWRSAEIIPAGGPWTTWEAVYLAAAWLEKRGWKAEVWFQHVLPQSRESISCASALEKPLLYLVEPGGKKGWYYVPGQPVEPGQIPVSLRGKTVYSAGNKKLRRKAIGGTHLGKNRISLSWDLDVNADCIVEGKLDLRVRSAWVEMYESLLEGRRDLIYSLLDGIEGWIDLDEEPKISPLGSQGFKMIFSVKARSGIEDARGLMIGLPSVTPGPLLRLYDVQTSAILRFPFVVEQSYNVKLPHGYRALAAPLKQEQGSMVGSYQSQYHINQRKNLIEGEEKLIQNDTRVDAPYLPGFRRTLDMWGTWKNNNLALITTGHSERR